MPPEAIYLAIAYLLAALFLTVTIHRIREERRWQLRLHVTRHSYIEIFIAAAHVSLYFAATAHDAPLTV